MINYDQQTFSPSNDAFRLWPAEEKRTSRAY